MVFNQSLWKESVNTPRGLNPLRTTVLEGVNCFCVDGRDRKPGAPEWCSLKHIYQGPPPLRPSAEGITVSLRKELASALPPQAADIILSKPKNPCH